MQDDDTLTADAADLELEAESSAAPQAAAPLLASIAAADAGERLDKVLARLFPQFSRSRLKVWCEAGHVRLDGQPAAPRSKARFGAAVELSPPADVEAAAFSPQQLPLQLVWSDAEVAVIDKPAGLVVHPAAGNWSGTLLNALLWHFPQTAALPRAGIVHRLDKDTSGLLVVGLSLTAQTDLVRQLQARTVSRQYLALAWGALARTTEVDAPIARHPRDRLRMAVVADGKPAQTRFLPLATIQTPWGAVTALRCRLGSGRTHQIRVHAQHLGLPLLGDPLYGRRGAPALPLQRQALHAARLSFDHPVTRQRLAFTSSLAPDIVAQWQQLGGDPAALDSARWSDDV